MRRISGAAAASGLMLAASCAGGLANFDDLSEGKYGQTLVDAGVTFSDAIIWDGTQTKLCVDDASAVFQIFPGIEGHYSSPNVMTFGIFEKGPSGWASQRAHEVRMTRGKLDTAASLDVFYWDCFAEAGMVLRLDALLDGQVVATDSFTDPGLEDPPMFMAHTLAVGGGPFDSLRLWVSEGPYGSGFLSVDNVKIVPGPWTLGAVALGAGFRRRRRA